MKNNQGYKRVALVLVGILIAVNIGMAAPVMAMDTVDESMQASVIYNGYESPYYGAPGYVHFTYRDDEVLIPTIDVIGDFGVSTFEVYDLAHEMERGPYDGRFFELGINNVEPGVYPYQFRFSDGTLSNDPANPNIQAGKSIATVEGLAIPNVWNTKKGYGVGTPRTMSAFRGETLEFPETATRYQRNATGGPIITNPEVTYSIAETNGEGVELNGRLLSVSQDSTATKLTISMSDGEVTNEFSVAIVKRVRIHFYDPAGYTENMGFGVSAVNAENQIVPFGYSFLTNEVDAMGRVWKTGYLDILDYMLPDSIMVLAAGYDVKTLQPTWMDGSHRISLLNKEQDVWIVRHNCNTFTSWQPEFPDMSVIRNAKEATCTEAGYSGDRYCFLCGELLEKGAVVNPKGHEWDEGTVTTTATKDVEGVKTFQCKHCTVTKTESIPKLLETREDTLVKKDTILIGKKATYRVSDEKKQTVVYQKPNTKKVTSVSVPSKVTIAGKVYSVTEIAKGAFAGCKKLKKVTIAKNVKKIGTKAFYGCSKLSKIAIQYTRFSKKTIGKNAFGKISKTATFDVPNSCRKSYRSILRTRGAGKKCSYK